MPIRGVGWEIHIERKLVQTRGPRTRTVGSYRVFHDGAPAATIQVGAFDVALFGTTAEPKGPSQNARPATVAKPSRIARGTYRLQTSGGPDYKTSGYRPSDEILAPMPGIELRGTGNRTDIIIHPGKNEFISTIGCINLCTSLPDANENIDYPGSRRRVIALIEDMRRFLGAFPDGGDRLIPRATIVIDEITVEAAGPFDSAENKDGIVDGNIVAKQHGVEVKAGAKISALDVSMEKVIVGVAAAAAKLGLPKPVITSGNDSKHMAGSLHFKGRALDFRGRNLTLAQGMALDAEVTRRLGKGYDVIFENPGPLSSRHLHVEFDPA